MSVAGIVFQACSLNRSDISPTLESTGYGSKQCIAKPSFTSQIKATIGIVYNTIIANL
jgi:hypothetical protein